MESGRREFNSVDKIGLDITAKGILASVQN